MIAAAFPRLCLAALAIAALLSTASCSGVDAQPERVELLGQIEQSRILGHLEDLTALGPRRAGDDAAQKATVALLREKLEGFGYKVFEERWPMIPNSLLLIHLGEETLTADGVYFGANISQARVVHGYVDALGLRDRFTGFGMEYAKAPAVDQVNVFVTIPGTRYPERVLELSAHHDTVPGTVGANDNTSGVAVLLEVARVLMQAPPECSVRFCFFAAEEIGLWGAQEHIKRMQEQERIGEVFGLINLDTVGLYTDEEHSQQSPARIPFVVWPPTTGNFLTIIGNKGSSDLAHLVEDSAAAYTPDLPTYSLARLGGMMPDAHRSDHAPYWDAGIPAVFLTDTAEFRSDNYHRPQDELSTLHLPKLTMVAAVVAAAALEACEKEAEMMASTSR